MMQQKIVHDSFVSPYPKWDLQKTNKKLCVAKNVGPACDLRIFGQPLYLPNQQVLWRFDLEETNVLSSRVSACPSHCFVCLLFHLWWSSTEPETLTDLRPPPTKKTFAKKQDKIFNCLGGKSDISFWSRWFSKFPSLISCYIISPQQKDSDNFIRRNSHQHSTSNLPNSASRYAAFDKRDLLLNGIEQAINSSNKHTKVGGWGGGWGGGTKKGRVHG